MNSHSFKEKLSDLWETPQWLFNELNEEFHFEIDLSATILSTRCGYFMVDYLTNNWQITRGQGIVNMLNKISIEESTDWKTFFCSVFMNPPYSNPYPFVEKAWEDSKYCKIVCVLPSKTDTKWWRIFWDSKKHRPKEGCEVRFMPYKEHHKSRVAFINPETKEEVSGNPCGTAIVIFDRRER